MVDQRALRDLVREYGGLCNGVLTPQARGQRLNSFLAEMLRCWGHRAKADLNARGNLDVVFAIGAQRFILEAKWEASPLPVGPIAKLQKRVRQRLAGTVGLLVSMSGYTSDALDDVKDGERLEVLLLEKPHVEAMLTGFSPPEELLNLLMDVAHYNGEPTATLGDLLKTDDVGAGFEVPTVPASRTVAGSAPTSWLVSGLRSIRSMTLTPDASARIVAGEDGVWRVDTGSPASIKRVAALSDVLEAREISPVETLVIRKFGVARLAPDGVHPLAGPFSGGSRTVSDRSGIAVFNNGEWPDGPPIWWSIGLRLGDQVGRPLDYPQSQAANALRLPDGGILLLGSPLRRFNADLGPVRDYSVELSNPFGGAVLAQDVVLLSGGDVDVLALDLESGETIRVAELAMHGAATDVVTVGSRAYVLAHRTEDGRTGGAIVAIDLSDRVSHGLSQIERGRVAEASSVPEAPDWRRSGRPVGRH